MMAGHKLDVLIAEKVFGWLRWGGITDWDGPENKTFFSVVEGGLNVYDNGAGSPRLFRPSADIADAWKVVEYMNACGWWLWVAGRTIWFQNDPDRAEARLTCVRLLPEIAMPCAICLAALTELGVEVPE